MYSPDHMTQEKALRLALVDRVIQGGVGGMPSRPMTADEIIKEAKVLEKYISGENNG